MTSFTSARWVYTGHKKRKVTGGLIHLGLICYNIDYLTRCAHWCNRGITVMRVTNCIIIGPKACTAESNPCLVLCIIKDQRLRKL